MKKLVESVIKNKNSPKKFWHPGAQTTVEKEVTALTEDNFKKTNKNKILKITKKVLQRPI